MAKIIHLTLRKIFLCHRNGGIQRKLLYNRKLSSCQDIFQFCSWFSCLRYAYGRMNNPSSSRVGVFPASFRTTIRVYLTPLMGFATFFAVNFRCFLCKLIGISTETNTLFPTTLRVDSARNKETFAFSDAYVTRLQSSGGEMFTVRWLFSFI